MFEYFIPFVAQSSSFPPAAAFLLIGIVIAVVIFVLWMARDSSSDEKKDYFESEDSQQEESNNTSRLRIDPEKRPSDEYQSILETEDFQQQSRKNPNRHRYESQQNPASVNPDVKTKFVTLLGYGKFISGAGWFMIVCAALIFLAGVASSDDTKIMFMIIGSFILASTGLIFVVSGQVISCFVSIEKNTRATSEMLKIQNQTIIDR